MAGSHHQDHENGLIDHGPARGEFGAAAQRTVALFAIGFALGAVAIGAMGIAIKPVDPPGVRPIKLRSPDQHDRSGDGADRRRDRGERRQQGRSERRQRRRPRAPAAPTLPRAPQQQPAQPAPPSTPAPRPQPRPAPAAPAPQPAPPAPAPPQADDDHVGDADPDEYDGTDHDDAGATGGLDDDVD